MLHSFKEIIIDNGIALYTKGLLRSALCMTFSWVLGAEQTMLGTDVKEIEWRDCKEVHTGAAAAAWLANDAQTLHCQAEVRYTFPFHTQ